MVNWTGRWERLRFLIAYSMQRRRGRPGPFYHMNYVSVYLGRNRRDPLSKERIEPGVVASLTFETLALGAESTR